MKSVVKRYIFESQKDDSSPIEGEVEELKQDLSSFRFEVLNRLDTQARALQESINAISAKLDFYTGQQYGGEVYAVSRQSSATDSTGPQNKKVLSWKCTPPDVVEVETKHRSAKPPSDSDSLTLGDTPETLEPSGAEGSIDEEQIVPQKIYYGYEDTLPQRGKPGVSKDCSLEQPKALKKRPKLERSGGTSPGTISRDKTPSPIAEGNEEREAFRPQYLRSYSKDDLDHFINLLESSC